MQIKLDKLSRRHPKIGLETAVEQFQLPLCPYFVKGGGAKTMSSFSWKAR